MHVVWMVFRRAFAIVALFALVLGPGCAERDPIDRVQLGKLPKSFFVGADLQSAVDDPEFYFRTTLVDVSAGAGSESLFTSSDSQPTVRIRWEITETKLIARLAYELIDDTDGKGTTGAPRGDEPRAVVGRKAPARNTTDGQIVASFTILKHFDVRAEYNPETGEENNVLVENDFDRTWQQREFMRVDFSTNLVTDAYDLDAASQMSLYGAVKWDPIAYQVTDPADPDYPVFDASGGYFDVTAKAYAAPQVIEDEEWGSFPACWLTGSFPQISCNPSEVKLRLAFRKRTETDYEPVDWDGAHMDLFGFFTNDRYGYDRRYGVVDDRWHRMASRWNLYETSHAAPTVPCATEDSTPPGQSPHRDDDGDGTEDECAAVGRGSRCDDLTGACTVPYRDRKVRTIPWHVNRDYPEDLFESAKTMVAAWNDAMRVAVVSARLAECRRTHDGDCESKMGWPSPWSDDYVPPVGDESSAEVPAIFVLCHNPVQKGEDAACGALGTSPRLGDLRFNFINYVTSPQAQAPWGIMVDAEDPLTGEKIAGSVNQYGATLDRAAGSLVDLVQLLNGVTTPDQFIAGKDVAEWVRANTDRGAATRPAPLSARERASLLSAFDPKVMAPFASGGKVKPDHRPALLRHRERMNELSAAGKLGVGNAAIGKRLTQLRETDIEAKLITPEMVQASGLDPQASVGASTVQRASPFNRLTPWMRRGLERRALIGRAARHACRREAPEADHLIGLARKARDLFGTVDPADAAAVKDQRDKIYQWARETFSTGVFSHEFGHSMGLRHNFAGTFDSLNYDNRYWQLRTRNGSVTQACAPGTTDGADCIGPRYEDPLTDDEVNGQIGGYATSSVMDYPGDQALDMYLLGKYDRAALRFGYGGVVDVWADAGSVDEGSTKAYELTGFVDPPSLFGVLSFPQPDGTSRTLHYSQYAAEFGLLRDCGDDTCKGAPLDVVDYRDMKSFAPIPEYAAFFSSRAAVDPAGRVRHGYMFSSDEYADSGNVPSFAYDAGADPYEQIRFLESSYENRYVLDNFRRNRTMFNSWDQVQRVQAHYLDAIQLIAKTFAFAMVLEVTDPANPAPELLSDGNYGPLAAGSSVAFDLFARMIVRPEPGSFCSTENEDCPNVQPDGLTQYIYMADPYPVPSLTAYDFTLPLGVGRYIHNDFDYTQGYYWSDYQKQVGSFYDKIWATYYLSEAFDSFISNSKEDFIDGRYKNVNFATVYPAQMRRLFAGLLTGDLEAFAPVASAGGKGNPLATPIYPDFHDATSWGERPVTAKIIDPAFGWNEQLYSMVWGTALLPTTFSNSFIEDARISLLSGEQMGWPAAETITFVDPETGLTYRAHGAGTETVLGKERQKGIGASMLDWANNLVLEAYVVEVDAEDNYVFNDDGTPKLVLDAAGKPQLNPDFPGVDATLRRYVANLDTMRQLTATFLRPLSESLPDP